MASKLRLRHTQLLLRGGARTPLEALEPESFWRSSLPNETLLRRHVLSPTEGARRKVRLESVWNQLTVRGMDESYALGRRIETWIFEHSHKNEEDEDLPTTVITSPDQRSMMTARAVLRGLCARNRQSDPTAVKVRTMRAALRVPNHQAPGSEDVAMDLTELLALDVNALEGAGWPRLLDVAETAGIFGLVPRGELDSAWKSCLGATYSAAKETSLQPASPLLRLTLEPAIWLKKTGGTAEISEKLRLVILPGFSLLCWASALRLPRFAQLWPAPSGCFLVETLDAEDGSVFLRIWNPRNHLELRPIWHQDDGPIPLERLLQELGLYEPLRSSTKVFLSEEKAGLSLAKDPLSGR